MLTRILAVAAFATLSAAAAQAGTIQNGTGTPTTCGTNPGDAPVMDGSSQKSYTKSAKDFQAWQDKAKVFADCVSSEAKSDQNLVVETTNKMMTNINTGSQKFVADANTAMESLKKKAGK
jgi:hypothetical protein